MAAPKSITCALLGIGILFTPLGAMAQWRSQTADSAKAEKLHAAHAVFTATTQGGLSSLSSLAQLQARQKTAGPRAALLYAAIDLPQQAENLLLQAKTLPPASAWLAIAQTYYSSQDFEAAERALLHIQPPLAPLAARQRASLLSRTLLQEQRYDEAALPLAAIKQLSELPTIDQYNLGIAWLGAGDEARGAGELNSLGRYQGQDSTLKLLAAQANLSLGYWLLRKQRAAQARSVLWRIPLHSPLARKALLALGWADFASTDTQQPITNAVKQECTPESAELWRDADPLHRVPRNNCRIVNIKENTSLLTAAPGYANAANRYERAAIAWQAAIQGGVAHNPIVAEALVALPYALVAAGDLAKAQAAYAQAIEALYLADKALAQATNAGDAPMPERSSRQLRLIEIEASLQQLQAHLDSRIEQLLAVPKNRYAKDVASILRKLRDNAPAGRRMAQPSAEERGQLLLALPSSQGRHASSQVNAQREQRLRQRQQQLSNQIQGALTAIKTQRQQLHEQMIATQRKRLREYSRQAALAFADLAQEPINQP